MPGKRMNSQARGLVANLIQYFTAEKENSGPVISLNAIQQVNYNMSQQHQISFIFITLKLNNT